MTVQRENTYSVLSENLQDRFGYGEIELLVESAWVCIAN